jgi:hypothetical protein
MSYVTKPPVTINHLSSIGQFIKEKGTLTKKKENEEEGQQRRRNFNKEEARAPLHSRNQHVQVGIQLDLLEKNNMFTSMVEVVSKH